MECPRCGYAAVMPGARCPKCGYVEQQAQPTDQVVMQPVGQGQPPTGPAIKSKLAAGLLGIFLGGLGVHRFYLGYIAIGVIQLVMTVVLSWFTCGIAAVASGIWGLAEGILILTGSINQDAQGRPLRE